MTQHPTFLLAVALAPGILIACDTMYPRIALVSIVVNPALPESLLVPAGLMTLIVYAAAQAHGKIIDCIRSLGFCGQGDLATKKNCCA